MCPVLGEGFAILKETWIHFVNEANPLQHFYVEQIE